MFNDAFFTAVRRARDFYDAPHSSWARPSASADALCTDPDEHALSISRLGVFLGATVSTDLPLMQARVLELYERAGEGREVGQLATRVGDPCWLVRPFESPR